MKTENNRFESWFLVIIEIRMRIENERCFKPNRYYRKMFDSKLRTCMVEFVQPLKRYKHRGKKKETIWAINVKSTATSEKTENFQRKWNQSLIFRVSKSRLAFPTGFIQFDGKLKINAKPKCRTNIDQVKSQVNRLQLSYTDKIRDIFRHRQWNTCLALLFCRIATIWSNKQTILCASFASQNETWYNYKW